MYRNKFRISKLAVIKGCNCPQWELTPLNADEYNQTILIIFNSNIKQINVNLSNLKAIQCQPINLIACYSQFEIETKSSFSDYDYVISM